jgi:hypothetical protein
MAATLEQAEAARAEFADQLARLGAHAIGVEPHPTGPGWAIVAYVDADATPSLPRSLKTDSAGKAVAVPLLVERRERFQLEKGEPSSESGL